MAKLSKKLKTMDAQRLVTFEQDDKDRRGKSGAPSGGGHKKEVLFIYKQKPGKTAKFSTREYTRCQICGRPHAVLKKFGICRICFRELAYRGEIPGVRKASW